jgi:hypothetical protein
MSYKPFSTLEKELSRKKGVYSPGGLAAYIARRKYGKRRVQRAAARGTSLRNAPTLRGR